MILAAGSYLIKLYNQLMAMSQTAINGFAQIEVQLKRRHDLIPNLVEATRGYMTHENSTLTSVIEARNQASHNLKVSSGTASDLQAIAASEAALGGAMAKFSMVMEAYPNLKADQSVASLMEELTSTENRISFARQLFNDLVTQFNMMRNRFPAVVFAAWIGYREDMSLLEYADAAAFESAPKVDLVGA